MTMTTLQHSVVSEPVRKPIVADAGTDSHGHGARAFLIYLATREIQLSSRVAGWLRTTGQRLANEGRNDLADDCVRLAAATWDLREQLIGITHRLVARRNRLVGHQRINAMQLLELPLSAGMTELIELNHACVADADPGVELEILACVEELLADTVPLALELAGFSHGDLGEAAEFYAGRSARAASLRALTDLLIAEVPARREPMRELRGRAIDAFTKITRESAELGRCLDGQPSTMS
jgi:hypothetical protein